MVSMVRAWNFDQNWYIKHASFIFLSKVMTIRIQSSIDSKYWGGLMGQMFSQSKIANERRIEKWLFMIMIIIIINDYSGVTHLVHFCSLLNCLKPANPVLILSWYNPLLKYEYLVLKCYQCKSFERDTFGHFCSLPWCLAARSSI